MLKTRNNWTKEEIELLKKTYPPKTINELIPLFPRHTKISIGMKSFHLRLSKSMNYLGHMRKSSVKKLSKTDIGYVSGLIDGEGTIAIQKLCDNRNNRIFFVPCISVSNTNLAVLEYLKQKIGAGHIYPHVKKKNYKICYAYELRRTLDIKTLLEQILQSLIIKKRQAETLIKFITDYAESPFNNRNVRTDLYEKIKEVNRKGN